MLNPLEMRGTECELLLNEGHGLLVKSFTLLVLTGWMARLNFPGMNLGGKAINGGNEDVLNVTPVGKEIGFGAKVILT